MARRVFFLVPEVKHEAGGINIILQFAELLLKQGVDTYLLCRSPSYAYPFKSTDLPSAYIPKTPPKIAGKILKYKEDISGTLLQKPKNILVTPGPDDIIVFPEFNYDTMHHLFPDSWHVLLTQNWYLQAKALAKMDYAKVTDTPRFIGTIATSVTCKTGSEKLTGKEAIYVPLALEDSRYAFKQDKPKVISYMPRRRREESGILTKLIMGHPALADYTLQPIENIPSEQVDDLLAQTLIFLSFSEHEGFGLPPAEAMAMGCLTVGYTGIGGDEFFTSKTGFPVPEDDLVGYFDTVINVVSTYERDPGPYDELRKHASDFILDTYTLEKTQKALWDAWQVIEARAQ